MNLEDVTAYLISSRGQTLLWASQLPISIEPCSNFSDTLPANNESESESEWHQNLSTLKTTMVASTGSRKMTFLINQSINQCQTVSMLRNYFISNVTTTLQEHTENHKFHCDS